VDPHQTEDSGWNSHFLLLHVWSDDPGGACLLAERLEENSAGGVSAPVPVLLLLLVSTFQSKSIRRFCSLIAQVVLLSDWSGGSAL